MRRSSQRGTSRTWTRARVYLVPVIILLAVTLPHLQQGDFRTDTGWYGAIGLSSVRHWPVATSFGDFLTLQAEPGRPFFNKPPLALWIHGVVLQVLGVSLAAARLPTILAACGCVLLTTAIVRRMGTRTQAMMAGVALALTLEFFRRTKEISLDMWQLLFMLAAVWVTVHAARRSGAITARNAAASGVLIGLALLCKPLVALLASVILGAWLVSQRRFAPRWALVHLATALAVAAPWYIVMAACHDGFLAHHFVGEVAERAAGLTTSGEAGKSGGGAERVWFYASVIAQTYWPWLITAVLALVALVRAEFTSRARSLALLATGWFIAWFVLLSIFPDRRPRYALALWPAGAALSGLWMGLPAARVLRPLVRFLATWGAPVGIGAGVLFAALPLQIQRPPNPQWPALFAWMESHNVREVRQGGFSGPSGSRLYLRFGAWPVPTQDRDRRIVAPPPDGALLIYHRRDGYMPGPREEILFHEGDLTLTRLVSGPWQPVASADPGEVE